MCPAECTCSRAVALISIYSLGRGGGCDVSSAAAAGNTVVGRSLTEEFTGWGTQVDWDWAEGGGEAGVVGAELERAEKTNTFSFGH